MQKFIVSRDDTVYQAWPDLALCDSGRLVCVFSECTHHGDRSYTRIMMAHSDDRGRTWTLKRPVSEPLHKTSVADPHWNCARVMNMENGRLCVVVDQVKQEGETLENRQTNWLFWSEDEGETWSGPHATPIVGIVPDKLIVLKQGEKAGRWLLGAHSVIDEVWMPRVWLSDDKGQTWSEPRTIAAEPGLKLCEGSITELSGGEVVCFMRENSARGDDAYKALSRDGGESWEALHTFASPGCHRPVAGILQSGKVMVTHRYLPGGRGGWGAWTQNTFVTITDVESCLESERIKQSTRVFPLDYDRSPHADTGYTGWVQFADGEIYVVNYIVDDAPKGHIRGYSFREEDFLLPSSGDNRGHA